jgi:hypothetical protein
MCIINDPLFSFLCKMWLPTIIVDCCMKPVGSFAPPAVISPRKWKKPGLLNDPPESTVPMISDSGFINKQFFLKCEAGKLMHKHSALGISQSDVCLFSRNSYEKVANMKIAKESFQITGLRPTNQEFFLMRIFYHQKSLTSPKEIWKKTHPAKLTRNYKCLCL